MNQSKYNPDSCKLALEAAREDYLYTERRWGHLISKTQALATTTTLLFAIFGFMEFKNPCSLLIVKIAYILALCSIVSFVLLLKNKNSSKVNIDPALNDSELTREPAIIAANLAMTYKDATNKSSIVINNQYKTYNIAVYFLLGTIFVGALSLLLEFSGDKIVCQETINQQKNQKPNQQKTLPKAMEQSPKQGT